MRVKNQKVDLHEGDLTPMIDMVFQLIAFFMVLINFSQTEANDIVKLPSSTLVRPAEQPLEFPIILHVGQTGTIVLGGEELTLQTLRPYLSQELAVLKAEGKSPADANIIIRAHKDGAAGQVQEIIRVCQEQGFEKFALRAKEDVNR